MKRIVNHILFLILFVSCSSNKLIFEKSEHSKGGAYLSSNENQSILTFTSGFITEKVLVIQKTDTIFNGLLDSSPTHSRTETIILNPIDTRIIFPQSKQDIILKSKDIDKHKFIYIDRKYNSLKHIIVFTNKEKKFL